MKTIVPAREGRAVRVAKGQTIRITTPKGAQAADFFAYQCGKPRANGCPPTTPG